MCPSQSASVGGEGLHGRPVDVLTGSHDVEHGLIDFLLDAGILSAHVHHVQLHASWAIVNPGEDTVGGTRAVPRPSFTKADRNCINLDRNDGILKMPNGHALPFPACPQSAHVGACVHLAGPGHAQAFNPTPTGWHHRVLAMSLLCWRCTACLMMRQPSARAILHFDPDTTVRCHWATTSTSPRTFTFPYLYVTVPDGEFPGQSFRMAVEKQPDMDDQQVYLQDTEGNWLALARQLRPTADLLSSSGPGSAGSLRSLD